MKKKIMLTAIALVSILCLAGFKPGPDTQYKVVKCRQNDNLTIQNTINANTGNGWVYHSTIIIPPDQNLQDTRCNLVFTK